MPSRTISRGAGPVSTPPPSVCSPLLQRGLAQLRASDERSGPPAAGKEAEAAPPRAGTKRRRDAIPHNDDLDCTLCLKLLYAPLSLPYPRPLLRHICLHIMQSIQLGST